MEKKTVNLKEIIQDITSGMHQTQLMAKHELSPAQLAKVMAKIETMGHIQRGARSVQPPETHFTDTASINCPNCRALVPSGSGDCPKCGIVLSRYQQTPAPSESAEHRIRSAASRAVALSPAPEPAADYAGKIITVAIIVAVVLVPYGMYRWFVSGLESSRIESHSALVRTVLKEVNQGGADYFKLAKKLALATADGVVVEARKDNGPHDMRKLSQIYSTLMALGNLNTQLEQREEAQGGGFAPARRSAGSGTSERANRVERLQSDLSSLEAALSRAQEVAAQAEASSRMHADQMAYSQGGEVASHSPVRTIVDGVDTRELERKRQELMDKISSESAKMTEAEQPAAAETSSVAEGDSQEIDDLREQMNATQEQLVLLCHEYLAMAGKTPPTATVR